MRFRHLAGLLGLVLFCGCDHHRASPPVAQDPIPAYLHRIIGEEPTPIPHMDNTYMLTSPAFLKLTKALEPKDPHPDWYLGWYIASQNLIFIRVHNTQHLQGHEYLVLLHEMAHRDDQALHQEGASQFWRILCSMPDGLHCMTHKEINAIVFPEMKLYDPTFGTEPEDQ